MPRARERSERPSEAAARMEQVFRANCPAVVSYVRRRAPEEAVDDVVAETFLVAWRRLNRVPAEPLPWLLAVARNVIGTQLRSSSRRHALHLRLRKAPPTVAAADHDAAMPAHDREPGGPVLAAMASLSERDREALMLTVWDGLAPRQAAAVLGESSSTFRARLYRAKRRLRRRLETQEQSARSHSLQAKEAIR